MSMADSNDFKPAALMREQAINPSDAPAILASTGIDESSRSELERSLEAIFHEVLGCGALDAHDDFFAAGGDSLMGTQVVARINAQHGVELPVAALFRHPAIASLAMAVDSAQRTSASAAQELAAEIAALSDEEVAQMLGDLRGAG